MVEGEHMTGDENQEFIADPSAFFLKKYIPRMFSKLGGLAMLPNFPQVTEIVDVMTLSIPTKPERCWKNLGQRTLNSSAQACRRCPKTSKHNSWGCWKN
jgi:hypothetical protein